jgi:hypothetical protein
MTQPGPRLTPFKKYSEVCGDSRRPEEVYWELLNTVPRTGAIGVASAVNNVLSVYAREQAAHQILQDRFIRPEIRKNLERPAVTSPSFTVVFNHYGCLLILRDLLLFGEEHEDPDITTFGDLALLANEFLLQDAPLSDELDLVISSAKTWDLNNQRDLAYSLSRMVHVLLDILASTDPTVARGRAEIGLDPESLQIGGLKLMDFVAVVFGLYAFANKKAEVHQPAIFDRTKILAHVNLPQALLDTFVSNRSLTISEFKTRLMSNGRTGSSEDFLKQITSRNFLNTDLNLFRQFPLVRLDADQIGIIDLQFLVELLNFGVYWSIFDSLGKEQRDVFKHLWGRLFELYVIDLLGTVYFASAKMLQVDVPFEGGQIDALIDCGPEIILFEVKSSILTESAKRSGDRKAFESDVRRKFIENEKGKPKALKQLARSAKAILNGKVETKTTVKRIYPVMVCDEPSVESFGFNTYLHNIFQKEIDSNSLIRPLTVMHIQELEEFLAYAKTGVIGWSQLLETRFQRPFSVSFRQDIYDFRAVHNLPVKRNQRILKRFEKIWQMINHRYHGA